MKRGKHTYRILKDARRQIARKAIILWGISAGLAAISPIAADTNSVYIHNLSANDTLTTAPVMPEFPGGTAALMKYLGANIKYPTISQEMGSAGKVIVQFVVDKDGTITDPTVVRGVDAYLDKEAIRVISSMPKWKPGVQNGKKVRVKYTVPVVFRLQ